MTNLKDNNISVTKQEGEAHITGVLSVDALEKHRAESLDFFREHVDLDGFRKGNIPDEVLTKNVPETALLEHMAELALNELYPTIIEEHDLQVIGRPSVQFTKVTSGQPIEFSIDTALMPDVTLPDYKKIAQETGTEQEEAAVTDEEVDRSLLEVRKMLAQKRTEANKAAQETGEEADTATDSKEEDTRSETETDTQAQSEDSEEDSEPPELTDQDVQELGSYKTVDEFRKSVREDLKRYKKERNDEKNRVELADALVDKADITLPSMLIDSEMRAMEAQFAENLKRSNISKEDYLKHVNKTEEDLKKEWQPEAEKRAKLQLILNNIAAEEDITADKDAVEKEVENIVSQDPSIPRDRAEAYVDTTHRNQAVFDFLEKQKKGESK